MTNKKNMINNKNIENNENTILFFFTSKYPFDKGEEFISSELNVLSKYFSKIYIIPTFTSGKNLTKKIPDNCYIIEKKIIEKIYKNLFKNNMYKRMVAIKTKTNIKTLIDELMFSLKYIKLKYIFKLYDNLSFRIFQAYIIYKYTKDYIFKTINNNDNYNIYFYSYWTNVNALSFLYFKDYFNNLFKKKYKNDEKNNFLNIKFISRMHGYDLYSFRRPFNYQEFQFFIITKIMDKVFINSKYGFNHIISYYNKENKENIELLKNKLKLSYLGIDTFKYINNVNKIIRKLTNKTTTLENILNNKVSKNKIKIVTCSYIVPVKRIELIIDFIKKIPYEVEWTHIGSGNSQYSQSIIKKALEINSDFTNKNKTKIFIYKGYLDNNKIHEFYFSNNIDFILNFSSSEAVPVSIMEAMLYGIVPIATEVGGIPEIIDNEKNGYLISSINPVEDALVKIKKYVSLNDNEKKQLKINAINTILNKFDSNKNYNRFIIEFLNLNKYI